MSALSTTSLLVTGGTGSFGRAFVARLVRDHPEVRRIVVYSRDELKQSEMMAEFAAHARRLRFFLGDVRDKERLARAMEGVDGVVHAAALKQIPAAEYNPFEFVKTNVLGAQNVIECSLDRGVKRVVGLSTDKAAAPINLYGATKLCADRLFSAANQLRGARDLRLCTVRYGNVLGSRGSVIPLFLNRRRTGALPITDPSMTRFNITLEQGVDLVLLALREMQGGEIFVPKLPSFRVVDLAEAVAPSCRLEVVGIRPGEKIHEDLITSSDALSTLDLGTHFLLLPPSPTWDVAEFIAARGARRCEPGFHYQSGTNSEWLTVEDLRRLIRVHVDPTFEPT